MKMKFRNGELRITLKTKKGKFYFIATSVREAFEKAEKYL